jgi:hypothetical protein
MKHSSLKRRLDMFRPKTALESELVKPSLIS